LPASATRAASLPGGWRVIADSKDLQHLATEEDANRGLAVFALWDEFGMIDSYTPATMAWPAHITYNLYDADCDLAHPDELNTHGGCRAFPVHAKSDRCGGSTLVIPGAR